MKSHFMKNRLIWLGLLAAAVAGCALNPAVTEMMPQVSAPVSTSSGKTVQVMPLKEGDTWKNSLEKWNLKADSFQEALVATLRQTGRFQEVFTAREGDYLLHPTLVSLGVNHGLPTTMHLFIHYRLVDARSGKEIWQGNLYSQGNSTWGRGQVIGAYEAAVKSNLSQVAQKLSALEL